MLSRKETLTHFHLFCGLGGGAAGFNRGRATVGNVHAEWECIGGVDVDPAAIKDFNKLSGATGTVLDMFTREQYAAFHGSEPPAGWQESTPADIRKAAGGRFPNAIFLSSPCKGLSGLLSQKKSTTPKYKALNELTLRGVWLALEAFKDDLPELFIFENVPRIATRGRHLLDQICALFHAYGYATAETVHDCGELGGLAQSRRRFLLVARNIEKVPAFLYEPSKRPLASVGSVLDKMLLPGNDLAGPMHRVPSLQWKTWVRLAFVEAGKDWRSLNRLNVDNGQLSDYLIVPEYRSGFLGVCNWNHSMGCVAGKSLPTNGKFSVADPRFSGLGYSQYGVVDWQKSTGVVTGQRSPGQGRFSVSDPRVAGTRHNNVFRVVKWDHCSGAVTAGTGPSAGGQAVADPRGSGFAGKYRVTPFDSQAGTVLAGSTTGQGAFAVSDPRPALNRTKGSAYLTGGHYGVVPWASQSYAVSASACHDNGHWSVADPRLPSPNEKINAMIVSEDGTWHRPFTTLELAALQGLYDPEEDSHWLLDGKSDSSWRERIGNAVPPPAATAVASVMGEAILMSRAGHTFQLSSTPVWVRPIAMGLSLSSRTAA